MILEIFLDNMAKKRTKKDRLQSELRRQKKVLPLKQEIKQVSKPIEKEVKQEVNYLKEIFAYNPQLIIKDLRKTFLVFIFILLVLLTVALLYT
jgi:hypothetical protein